MWNDEFAYSFIYGTNERVNSIFDIFKSQMNLYHQWTGRNIVHFIVQFFLWIGKDFFNVFNSLMFILLIFLTYLFSKNEDEAKYPSSYTIILLLLFFWFGLPELGQTIFWVAGSVNYLWTTIFILVFLLPYKNLLDGKQTFKNNNLNCIIMAILGLISGWSQENTAVIVIFLISLSFIYFKLKKVVLPAWYFSGIVSLILGFIILISAPGNFVRSKMMYYNLTFGQQLINYVTSLLKVAYELKYIIIVLFLLFIVHLFSIKQILQDQKDKRNFFLAVIFALSGIISFFAMIVSPEFPLRAAFGGAVCFIISILILLNLGIPSKLRKLPVLVLLFPITVYMLFSMIHVYQNYKILSYESLGREWKVEKELGKGNLNVKLDPLSVSNDRYTFIYDISLNPNYTTNVHFAKFHGLKSVQIDTSFISIEFDNPNPDLYQIYFDTGKGFNELNSSKSHIYNKVDGNILYFAIPDGNIKNLRIDPGTKPQIVRIKNITFTTSVGEKRFSAEEIFKNMKPNNQIDSFKVINGVLEIHTNGNDPNFEMNIDTIKTLFLKKPYIELDVSSHEDSPFQIFYDTGNGYNEKQSAWDVVDHQNSQTTRLHFLLPEVPIFHLRIDPGFKSDTIVIKGVTIVTENNEYKLTLEQLKEKIKPLNQIDSVQLANNGLQIKTIGGDPSFELLGIENLLK